MAVASHAPLHASVGSSLTHACLPQDLTFAIGIESVDHSRLLPGQQHFAASVEFVQDDGRSVVAIGTGTVAFGAA